MSSGPYDFLEKANANKRKVAGQQLVLYAVIAAVVLLILFVKGLFQPNVFKDVLTESDRYVAQKDYASAYQVLKDAYNHKKNESYNKPLTQAANSILDQLLPGCYTTNDFQAGSDASDEQYTYLYIPAKTDPLYEKNVIYMFYDTAILSGTEEIISKCKENPAYRIECYTYKVMPGLEERTFPRVQLVSQHYMIGGEEYLVYFLDEDIIELGYRTFMRVGP